jgi:TRAP transporter TAXI family solute receptor
MRRRAFVRLAGRIAGGAIASSAVGGCDVREFARRHGGKQRLSVATGGTGGVFYVYGGAIAKVISAHVPNVEATAEVTSASIDNLKFLHAGRADLAFTTADVADDAYRGVGAFRSIGRAPVVSLARLYTNYVHLVTLTGTGIARLADLRGRVVSTGVPGSSTATASLRVLRAAGLDPDADVERQSLGIAPSVDALRDGKIDATFQGGGAPLGGLLDLLDTPRGTLRLVPIADVVPTLQQRYGRSLYFRAAIPRAAYPGLREDVPVVGTAVLLVADASLGDTIAYEITRALFDHQPEIAAVHPEGSNLRLESATQGSPLPFHPGAIRFYRERGAWRG